VGPDASRLRLARRAARGILAREETDMRFAAAAAPFALLAAACGARTPEIPPEPALATVHDARLRGHMSRLGEVVISDLSTATKAPTIRRDLAGIAVELEEIATRLPDLVYTLDLDDDQASHFVLFADSLGASAIRLGEAAPTAPGNVIQERIDEVTNACSGCHWAFRAGPGGT
jgi:hypothetical protein